jgi:hypothetical protein
VANRWEKVLNPVLCQSPWRRDDDFLIVKWVEDHGPKDWSGLAERLSGRLAKQCRERWHNHLSPAVRKTGWTAAEDSIVIEHQQKWGNKWARIAALLPGRTDNAVKNRWNSSLKGRFERDSRPPSPVPKQSPALPPVPEPVVDITSPWFSPGRFSLSLAESEMASPALDDFRKFRFDKEMLEAISPPRYDDFRGLDVGDFAF